MCINMFCKLKSGKSYISLFHFLDTLALFLFSKEHADTEQYANSNTGFEVHTRKRN